MYENGDKCQRRTRGMELMPNTWTCKTSAYNCSDTGTEDMEARWGTVSGQVHKLVSRLGMDLAYMHLKGSILGISEHKWTPGTHRRVHLWSGSNISTQQ